MSPTRRRFLGIIAAGSGAVAGCTGGGGEGDGASPTPGATRSPSLTSEPTEAPSPPPTGTPSPTETTPPPTETPTGTPTATPGTTGAREQFPDYEWGKLEGVDPTPTETIEMRGFEFRPLVAAFAPGTEVTVTNADSANHTITVPKLGIDETVGGGASATVTVDRAGTFDYVCEFHPPGMLGRLVVTASPSTETGTPTPTPTMTPTPTPTMTPTPTEDDGGGY